VVSYFKEEHKLQAFENKVLRKIFGTEKDRVNRSGYYI
jgi:hypothetical protein